MTSDRKSAKERARSKERVDCLLDGYTCGSESGSMSAQASRKEIIEMPKKINILAPKVGSKEITRKQSGFDFGIEKEAEISGIGMKFKLIHDP